MYGSESLVLQRRIAKYGACSFVFGYERAIAVHSWQYVSGPNWSRKSPCQINCRCNTRALRRSQVAAELREKFVKMVLMDTGHNLIFIPFSTADGPNVVRTKRRIPSPLEPTIYAQTRWPMNPRWLRKPGIARSPLAGTARTQVGRLSFACPLSFRRTPFLHVLVRHPANPSRLA